MKISQLTPQGVHHAGTLWSILALWFSSSRDKVTIVFEYINKDLAQSDGPVSQRFNDLNFALSDHQLVETISTDPPSPLPTLWSSSSYRLHSSPPPSNIGIIMSQRLTTNLLAPIVVPPQSSSSDSVFPTIEPLIVTTSTLTPDNRLILPTMTLPPAITDPSSSPLSTIPGSHAIPLSLHILPPTTMDMWTQIPLRCTSKGRYVTLS